MTETEIFERYGVPHVDEIGIKVGKDETSESYGVRFEIGPEHGFLEPDAASSMSDDLISVGAAALAEMIRSIVVKAREHQGVS